MKTPWSVVPQSAKTEDIIRILQDAVRLRDTEDLPDFANLNQVFVSGRSTNRIPSAFNDVQPEDNLGDITYALNGTFMYILVDVSGTPAWARVALDVGW